MLIVTRGNSNAAAGFKLITEVIALFKAYFNAFDEDSLRNNFVLIYELLDGASSCEFPLASGGGAARAAEQTTEQGCQRAEGSRNSRSSSPLILLPPL